MRMGYKLCIAQVQINTVRRQVPEEFFRTSYDQSIRHCDCKQLSFSSPIPRRKNRQYPSRYLHRWVHRKHPHSKVPSFVMVRILFMSASYPESGNQGVIPTPETHAIGLGNSERIRLKFGSYGIEVLESGVRIRVSNLYSIDNGAKSNRTFAVVVYPDVIEPEFSTEHDAIISGQSIGIVFKNHGWAIDKRHQYFGELELASNDPDTGSVFGGTGKIRPVVHVYSLFIKKNGSEFHYASIAEVHHPEYLDLEDLHAIYGNEFDKSLVQDEETESFLDIVKTKMKAVFFTA